MQSEINPKEIDEIHEMLLEANDVDAERYSQSPLLLEEDGVFQSCQRKDRKMLNTRKRTWRGKNLKQLCWKNILHLISQKKKWMKQQKGSRNLERGISPVNVFQVYSNV